MTYCIKKEIQGKELGISGGIIFLLWVEIFLKVYIITNDWICA